MKTEEKGIKVGAAKTGAILSSTLYTKILDEIDASISVIDAENYKVIYANRKALEATENMPGAYVGSVCYQYIHGLKMPCDHCIMERGAEAGFDFRNIKYKGKVYHQLFKKMELEGRQVLLEFTEDITEKEQTQQELDRAKLEIFIASQSMGILYWLYDVKIKQTRIVSGKSLGYNNVINNVPEVFRGTGEIYLEDEPKYFQQFKELEAGVETCECEVRVLNRLTNTYDWQRLIYVKQEEGSYIGCSIDINEQKKNEMFAEEKEQLKETLLQRVPIGLAVFHIKDHVVQLISTNQAMCDLLDTTLEQAKKLSSKEILAYTDEEFQPQIVAVMRELAKPNVYRKLAFKSSIKRKDKPIWLLLRAKSYPDEKGGTFIYAGYTDITESKELEAERQAASRDLEERYAIELSRNKGDSKVLAYGCFNITKNTLLEAVRREPLKPISAGNMSYSAFIQSVVECIDADDEKAEFLSAFKAENILEAKKKGIEEKSVDFLRTLVNGKHLWVRATYRLLLDPKDGDLLIVYTCRDIHDTKLIEHMSSYLLSIDYDLLVHVDFFDHKAILMYGKSLISRLPENSSHIQKMDYEKALELFVSNILVSEESEEYRTRLFLQNIRKELETKDTLEFTCHVKSLIGEIRTKKIQYTRDKSMPDACFITQIDITDIINEEERKRVKIQQALDAAKLANQAKSDFLSRMSHDMRTPMNGIIGLASLALDSNSVEELKGYIEQISASGAQLLGLINDTLDVSRIENGKLTYNPENIAAQKLLLEVVASARVIAEQKGVNFVLEKEGFQKTEIRTDVIKITKIFNNLLSNAIKFTPEGGTVTFSLKRLGQEGNKAHYLISVKDNGIGMSEEFQKHIFEPFMQENTTYSTNATGTGLGTTIVKSLVDFLGGRIELRSELGKGTEFKVWLDFEILGLDEKKESSPPKVEPVSGIHRILVAEDHPLNAMIAKKMLEKENYIVELAKNGRECADMFRQAEKGYYDLILMDIRMPIMDGLAATRLIRKYDKPEAKTIPIIAMTANAYAEDVKKCLEAGMDEHLGKPIEPQKLYTTLARYIKEE